MDADKHFNDIRAEFMEAEVKRRSAASKLEVYQALLKSGELKSSDEIRDFVIVYFGLFDEQSLKPYYELNEKLKNKKDSDVLFIEQKWRKEDNFNIGHLTGENCSEMDYSVLDLLLRYGKLNSDNGLEFDIKKGNIIINTGDHLGIYKTDLIDIGSVFMGKSPNFGKDYNWVFSLRNIINHYFNLKHLWPMPYRTRETEILAGNEVKEWFGKLPNGEESYKSAKELLENKLAA